MGFQAPREDSIGVGIISIPDGRFTQAFTAFGEGGGTSWMNDGSMIISLNDTQQSETLWHWKDGKIKRLGSTPRLISGNTIVTVSGDMSNAFVVTFDDRRDAWLAKVSK